MCIRPCAVHLCICPGNFLHKRNTCVCVYVSCELNGCESVIKALLCRLCGGSRPGRRAVMDGVRCQSLGSLLAPGTEVALLKTDLPHLSPNATARFKVNCFCGAARSPPRGTRLLPFVGNTYALCQRVCFAMWGWMPCASPRADAHVQQHMNMHSRTHRTPQKKQQRQILPNSQLTP